MRPNTLRMKFSFLSLSWSLLLFLNYDMWRFVYYGIWQEDCEGKLCSSPLGEARVAASWLISVGFCTLLECLTWWIFPSWKDTYPLEGIELSDLASVPCANAGSSVMTLYAFRGSDPWGISWGPGSSESFWQTFLGRSMLEDLLRCHSFARLNFSCMERYKFSSTKIFQFPGTVPFLMFSIVDISCQKPHGTGGGLWPFLVCNTRTTDPAWNGKCPR